MARERREGRKRGGRGGEEKYLYAKEGDTKEAGEKRREREKGGMEEEWKGGSKEEGGANEWGRR